MTKTGITLIILACIFIFSDASAQRHIRHKRNSSYFRFKSATFGAGLYKPYLDYWNERSFVKDWDTKFKSAPVVAGNIEFECFKQIGVRIEGQYWTNKVSNHPNTAESGILDQDLSLSLLPITGCFTFDLAENSFFRSYIGAGAGICLVSTQFNRIYIDPNTDPSHENASGTGNIYVLLHGFDFSITKRLRIGVETKYTTGSYDQSTINSGKHEVKLNGLQVLVNVCYYFYDKKISGRFATRPL